MKKKLKKHQKSVNSVNQERSVSPGGNPDPSVRSVSITQGSISKLEADMDAMRDELVKIKIGLSTMSGTLDALPALATRADLEEELQKQIPLFWKQVGDNFHNHYQTSEKAADDRLNIMRQLFSEGEDSLRSEIASQKELLRQAQETHGALEAERQALLSQKQALLSQLGKREMELNQANASLRESEQRSAAKDEEITSLRQSHDALNQKSGQDLSRLQSTQLELDAARGLDEYIWPNFVKNEPFRQLKDELIHELASGQKSPTCKPSLEGVSLISSLFRYQTTPCIPDQGASVTAHAAAIYDLSRSLMYFWRSRNIEETQIMSLAQRLVPYLQETAGSACKIVIPVLGQPFDNLTMVATGRNPNASTMRVSRVNTWTLLRQTITMHRAEVETA